MMGLWLTCRAPQESHQSPSWRQLSLTQTVIRVCVWIGQYMHCDGVESGSPMQASATFARGVLFGALFYGNNGNMVLRRTVHAYAYAVQIHVGTCGVPVFVLENVRWQMGLQRCQNSISIYSLWTIENTGYYLHTTSCWHTAAQVRMCVVLILYACVMRGAPDYLYILAVLHAVHETLARITSLCMYDYFDTIVVVVLNVPADIDRHTNKTDERVDQACKHEPSIRSNLNASNVHMVYIIHIHLMTSSCVYSERRQDHGVCWSRLHSYE